MKKHINILYLEDDDIDFDLIKCKLESTSDFSFDIQMVSTQKQYEAALQKQQFDIVLSDYNLKNYTGLDALKFLNKSQYSYPFILLSGAIGDELAVEIMKQGAFDYILKDHLEKLPLVIERGIESYSQRQEKIKWESMFHTIEKAALAGFFRLDIEGNYTYSNTYFQKMLSLTKNNLLNKQWYYILDETEHKNVQKSWKNQIKSKGYFEKLQPITASDGLSKWIKLTILAETKNKKVVGYIGVVFDISAVKEAEQQLELARKFDPITSLPNKESLEASIKLLLTNKKIKNIRSILLFSNIDGFKRLNESLGHKAGDKVLKKVAILLSEHYGDNTIIARFNNDTFAILLNNIQRASEATLLIDNLAKHLSQNSIIIEGDPYFLTLTTGIAKIPDAGNTPSEIFQHADQALHQAKFKSRGRYSFYTSDISDKASRNIELEHALHYGISNNEIYLAYQPQINIINNKVNGMEALCRWQSKTLGPVSPGELIPMAEKTGLIFPLTKYLCKQFFYDLESLLLEDKTLFANVTASFNLSAKLISESDFLEFIISEFNRYDINSNSICFEVTETAIMENPKDAKLFMSKLSNLGFSLSIDDFGTGQSSLSYLKSLPVQELKIDMSFIKNIISSRDDLKIVKAIIHLAQDLKLKVIAEGVENKEQLLTLKKLKCESIQGYYYSEPLKLVELLRFLKSFGKPGDK